MKQIPYKNNSDEDDETIRRKRKIFLLIVLLILLVLTFAWFYFREKRRKVEERENKKLRLQEVESQILILQAKKERIERDEKLIKRWTRISIAAILVTVNYFYFRGYQIAPFDFDKYAGRLLNLNACIVTGYTFIAFVSYGSIDNFVKKLKSFLVKKLHEYHMYSLEELEALKAERDQLKADLNQNPEL